MSKNINVELKLLNKIYTLIILILSQTSVFGQGVSGLSYLKIGMTIEDFLKAPAISAKDVKDGDDQLFKPEEQYDLWRTTIDSKKTKHYRVFSPDITIFHFNDNFDNFFGNAKFGKPVFVEFYKNKLAFIYIGELNIEILPTLIEKYGKPSQIRDLKPVICQNSYGNKEEYKNGTVSTFWGKGKKINATFLEEYEKCWKFYLSYTVQDVKSKSLIDKLQGDGLAAEQSKKLKSDAKSTIF